ncbi:MAG: hypothetical protein U1E22_07575 [Coriobacteriia bacterium]|nr:hypothetical protein [Coriobacteriia bacterium]
MGSALPGEDAIWRGVRENGLLEESIEEQVAAYSWAAQCRCNGTYRRIAARKGAHTAVVATARELSGFVRGLMTGNMGA